MPLSRIVSICTVLFALFMMTGVGWGASDRPGLKDFAQRAFGVQADLRERVVNDEVVYEAWRGGDYLGTAVSTWDLVRSVGYSGQPIDIWAAVDSAGTVVSARLVRQTEPLLVIGLSPAQLESLVSSLSGLNVSTLDYRTRAPGAVDHIAGATISSNVLRDSVVRAARKALRASGQMSGDARINRDLFEALDWLELIRSGSIVERKFYPRDLGAGTEVRSDDPLLVLYVGLATPAAVGVNLLGRRLYEHLISTAGPDDNLVFAGANGLLSIKGTAWRETGVFERLALLQDQRTIRLTREMHRSFERIAAEGAPELRERAVFVVPHSSGFDPTRPWRLQVLATRTNSDGEVATSLVDATYEIPAMYVRSPPVEEPAWLVGWRARIIDVAGLCAFLSVLIAILMFQDQLTGRPALYWRVRLAFMAGTLLFLGFYERAQLSVVQVVTFVQALRTDFQWSLFLVDPMIFILWSFVAVSMMFWGRGVFCGWLCPFGAFQELLNELARRLGIRQFDLPWPLHERLWIIKYLVFLGIFALSLNSMELAFTAAEVEPFKTAVALRFQRSAPFIVFAVVVLASGLFVRRIFCRYLCPLGAALALPARLRMFEWLKRRPQCGRECRQCAVRCPVGAIYPGGAISPNECIYCLNCQSLYHDVDVCLGLKAREGRRQARAALAGENR